MNRRKMLSLLGISPALLTGVSKGSQAKTQPIHAQPVRGAASSAGKVVALNPKNSAPPVHLVPMTPRFHSLDEKTVFLVDDGFLGGNLLLNQMQLWFERKMPTVKAVYRVKVGSFFQDDPKLWAEIKAANGAMVMAIGH
jgi:hypothetical protein